MSDTIYRQDAIDALNKHIDTFDAIDTNYLCGLRTAMSILKEMPSAQLERKKGKWITVDGWLGNEVECDKCHSVFWYWMGNYKFCPHCGADMRGESDE